MRVKSQVYWVLCSGNRSSCLSVPFLLFFWLRFSLHHLSHQNIRPN